MVAGSTWGGMLLAPDMHDNKTSDSEYFIFICMIIYQLVTFTRSRMSVYLQILAGLLGNRKSLKINRKRLASIVNFLAGGSQVARRFSSALQLNVACRNHDVPTTFLIWSIHLGES